MKKEIKCTCRKPKRHPGCMYCGYYYSGEYICGVCKEAGIDGKLIRSTARYTCALHRNKK